MAINNKKTALQDKTAKIINLIKFDKINTRTAISQKLGVAKSAITEVINHMIEKKLIVETGYLEKSKVKGRNQVVLQINDNYKFLIGVVVDKNEVKFILSTFGGTILDNNIQINLIDSSYHDMLSIIVDGIKTVQDSNCISNSQIFGVGICVSDEIVNVVDGTGIINKIEKDLRHAINHKIIVKPLIEGLLISQKVFLQQPMLTGSMMIIRYGKSICSGFCINSEISPYHEKIATGFRAMQIDGDTTTYEQYLIGEQVDLAKKIAQDIILCNLVVYPQNIYVLGDYFEDESLFNAVSIVLENESSPELKIECYFINNDTIAIAGCGAILSRFYLNGEFQ